MTRSSWVWARRCQDRFEAGAELTAVRRDTDGTYTLTIRRGLMDSECQSDHVVLAIPFPVLRESIDWSAAGFPAVKANAIQGLGMGTNTKLHVQFRTRHWNTLGLQWGELCRYRISGELGSHPRPTRGRAGSWSTTPVA